MINNHDVLLIFLKYQTYIKNQNRLPKPSSTDPYALFGSLERRVLEVRNIWKNRKIFHIFCSIFVENN